LHDGGVVTREDSSVHDGTKARQLLLDSFRWTDGHADFGGVFRDPDVLMAIGPALARPFDAAEVTAVVGAEARGFVVAALVARELGVGLVLARKPGSVHPGAARQVADEPDWRGRTTEFRISRQAVRPGDRLLLVDDWIETGSQARTLAALVGRLGAEVVGVSVLVDDTTTAVRRGLNVVGLVTSSELPAEDDRG
jgi:adenine phosphoribosyltransferase